MNFRKIAFAAATIAALAPAIASASPEKAALNACARALASSLAAPGASAPTFKVDYRGNQDTGSVLQFYASEYTFYLRANDDKTGRIVARASCTTDSHGEVIALTTAAHPTFAANR
jgi:hypothetical protein